MRNFRTSAVAAATALTVAFAGVGVASAQEETTAPEKSTVDTSSSSEDKGTEGTTEENTSGSSNKGGSSAFLGEQQDDRSFGEVLSKGFEGLSSDKGSSHFFGDAKDPFYGTDAFGEETDAESLPQWARYWIDATVVAGIGSLVGLVIAGFNWASFNGLIKF